MEPGAGPVTAEEDVGRQSAADLSSAPHMADLSREGLTTSRRSLTLSWPLVHPGL